MCVAVLRTVGEYIISPPRSENLGECTYYPTLSQQQFLATILENHTCLLGKFFGELMCFRTCSFEKPYVLDFLSFQESKLICVIHDMVAKDKMFTDPE